MNIKYKKSTKTDPELSSVSYGECVLYRGRVMMRIPTSPDTGVNINKTRGTFDRVSTAKLVDLENGKVYPVPLDERLQSIGAVVYVYSPDFEGE